ncbi:hypothetical protein GCK72_007782 [Caenorhabditis remanei]|uniref:C2H2-type domain-containing protein n=1 Tax=Caenorhabditis remanei TaxID=31234 RepID=A0A6A5HN85_CAERE|nr:hypothetical protein GCK72_007782 [Caenorhabditis remanei]KAF1767823.1 hypothetical protein GCK72_007782 [Caenorhabditis remanei]
MSGDQFKCQICRQSFDDAALREEHQRSRHKRSYKCDECGKRFPKPSKATAHIKTPHKSNANWIEEFNCNICGESRTSLKALQEHFKKRHFNNKNSQEFMNAWAVYCRKTLPKNPQPNCGGEPRGRGRPSKNPAVNQRRVNDQVEDAENQNGVQDNIGDDDDGKHEMDANERAEISFAVRRDDDLHDTAVNQPTSGGKKRSKGRPLKYRGDGKPRGRGRPPKYATVNHQSVEEETNGDNIGDDEGGEHEVEANDILEDVRRDDDLHEADPTDLPLREESENRVRVPDDAGEEDVVNLNRSPAVHVVPVPQSLEAVLPKNPAVPQPNCAGKPRGRGRPPKNRCSGKPRGRGRFPKTPAVDQRRVNDQVDDAEIVENQNNALDDNGGEHEMEVNEILENGMESAGEILEQTVVRRDDDLHQAHPTNLPLHEESENRVRVPDGLLLDHDAGEEDVVNLNRSPVNSPARQPENHEASLEIGNGAHNEVALDPEFDEIIGGDDYGDKEDNINLNNLQAIPSPEVTDSDVHPNPAPQLGFSEATSSHWEPPVIAEKSRSRPLTRGSDDRQRVHRARETVRFRYLSPEHTPISDENRGSKNRGSESHGWNDRVYNNEQSSSEAGSVRHTNRNRETGEARDRTRFTYPRLRQDELSSPDASPDRSTYRDGRESRASESTGTAYHRGYDNESRSSSGSYRDSRIFQSRDRSLSTYRCGYENAQRSSGRSLTNPPTDVETRMSQAHPDAMTNFAILGLIKLLIGADPAIAADTKAVRDPGTHIKMAHLTNPAIAPDPPTVPDCMTHFQILGLTHQASDWTRDQRSHGILPDRANNTYRLGYENEPSSSRSYDVSISDRSTNRRQDHRDDPSSFETLPPKRSRIAGPPVITLEDDSDDDIKCFDGDYQRSIFNSIATERSDSRMPRSYENGKPQEARQKERAAKRTELSAAHRIFEEQRLGLNRSTRDRSISRTIRERSASRTNRRDYRDDPSSFETSPPKRSRMMDLTPSVITPEDSDGIFCLESTICNMLYLDTRHNKIFKSVRDPTGLKEILEKSSHVRWPSVGEAFEKLMEKLEPLVSLEPIRFFEKRKIECRRGHELPEKRGEQNEPGQTKCSSLVKPHCSATFEQIFGLRFMETLYSPFCFQCLEGVFKKTVITPYGRYHVMLIDGSKSSKIQELTSESLVEMYGSRWKVVSFVECLPHQMEKDKDGYFVAWTRNETGEGWTSKKERFVEKMEKEMIVFRDHNVKTMVFEKIE